MKYNTKKHRITRIALILTAAVILAGIGWAVAEAKRPEWEPDCEYPMANARISWEQTFYAGGWQK